MLQRILQLPWKLFIPTLISQSVSSYKHYIQILLTLSYLCLKIIIIIIITECPSNIKSGGSSIKNKNQFSVQLMIIIMILIVSVNNKRVCECACVCSSIVLFTIVTIPFLNFIYRQKTPKFYFLLKILSIPGLLMCKQTI